MTLLLWEELLYQVVVTSRPLMNCCQPLIRH